MSDKNFTQESIFKNVPKEDVEEKQTHINETESKAPSNYYPIKLDSLGKLDAPKIVHVRGYTMEEILELGEMNDDNEFEVIANMLNNMVYEDFDAYDFHIDEVKEILLSIYAKDWSKEIEGFKYYVDEDLPEPQLNRKENISVATIPIANIETQPIHEEFKEPINIPFNDKTYHFRLPRIRTTVNAKDYTEKKFFAEERQFSDIRMRVFQNQAQGLEEAEGLNSEDVRAYRDFLSRRAKTRAKAFEAQLVIGVDEHMFETLEESMEELVPLTVWETFSYVRKNYANFGIQNEVKFQCSVTHQSITRRFQFRPLTFLPTIGDERRKPSSFSFG
jgi:hypothetical protein